MVSERTVFVLPVAGPPELKTVQWKAGCNNQEEFLKRATDVAGICGFTESYEIWRAASNGRGKWTDGEASVWMYYDEDGLARRMQHNMHVPRLLLIPIAM